MRTIVLPFLLNLARKTESSALKARMVFFRSISTLCAWVVSKGIGKKWNNKDNVFQMWQLNIACTVIHTHPPN